MVMGKRFGFLFPPKISVAMRLVASLQNLHNCHQNAARMFSSVYRAQPRSVTRIPETYLNSYYLTVLLASSVGLENRHRKPCWTDKFILQRVHMTTRASHIKRPKKKREGPGKKKITPETQRIKEFENIIEREEMFRFLTRTREYLLRIPEQVLQLNEAKKLYRELGFPKGRKPLGFIQRHPALLQIYKHTDDQLWFGFTDLMESLLEEENAIMDQTEQMRMQTVRKLLMMSVDKRISMAKFHHCRHIFGFPNDFRDRVKKYPQYFKIVEEQGRRYLELNEWDPALAVTALEESLVQNEDKVKKTFLFPFMKARHLKIGEENMKLLNVLNTLPLISPYADNSDLEPHSLDGRKYRACFIHEFLSLTIEKKASIHHLAEFKDEFNMKRDTFDILKRQHQCFYLSGTEINWTVFLKNAYRGGELVNKEDPLVVFKEKLFRYGSMKQDDLKLTEYNLLEDKGHDKVGDDITRQV